MGRAVIAHLHAPSVLAACIGAAACTPARTTEPPSTPAAVTDGQHDFDFEFGAWTVHLERLARPLSHSATWTAYDGTSVVRKVWDGRANLGELEVDGTGGHIEGLSLRLYDPGTHRWSISFASSRDGALTPALVGGFSGGRGEFYDHETYEGRPIRVRFVFSDVTRTTFRFEQSFSDDDGKTWEPNWVSTFTRARLATSALLGSPDRTDADRALDATRRPAASSRSSASARACGSPISARVAGTRRSFWRVPSDRRGRSTARTIRGSTGSSS